MSMILHLVRHAQASFGAADYDNLSALGHRQSEALGAAMARQGIRPDRVFIGAQKRHRQTWEGMAKGLGCDLEPTVLPGFNEFDFKGLLDARFASEPAPEGVHSDRRTHFRKLRETVLMWQRDEIDAPPERFADFAARVREAREIVAASGAETPVAVSSGGAIGQSVAEPERFPNQLADSLRQMGFDFENPTIVAKTGWTTDELALAHATAHSTIELRINRAHGELTRQPSGSIRA